MCERYLDGEDEEFDDWDDPAERYYREGRDDGEGPMEHLKSAITLTGR
jgi:hypothetical protein